MVADDKTAYFRDIYNNQQRISQEKFFLKRDDQDSTHRKVFGSYSAVQLNKDKPSFSVSFGESIMPIYEKMTGFRFRYSEQYNNFWHFLNDEKEICTAKKWEEEQGERVFLKDNLFSSIALSMYDRENTDIDRTDIQKSSTSSLFYMLKYGLGSLDKSVSDNIFDEAITRMEHTIRALPFYKACQYITAVPPRPGKTVFDLPSNLAATLAQRLGIENITNQFSYSGEKAQAKNLSREEKWQAWENAGLFCNKDLRSKDVLLIDDLYQSGISVNFVGMKLQEANCGKICGLYLVKSLNDRDNIQRNLESLS